MRRGLGCAGLICGVFGLVAGLSALFFDYFISPSLDYDSPFNYLTTVLWLFNTLLIGLAVCFIAAGMALRVVPEPRPEPRPSPVPVPPPLPVGSPSSSEPIAGQEPSTTEPPAEESAGTKPPAISPVSKESAPPPSGEPPVSPPAPEEPGEEKPPSGPLSRES